MKHSGTKPLTTERLVLRRLTLEDADDMFQNWANEEEVVKFLTWKKHETVKETAQILSLWDEMYQKDNFYQWAIVVKEINAPIGTISVVTLNENTGSVSIGYCIGSKWWGKGFVAEALNELIRFFFEEVGVNSINAKHDINNPNSGKVMIKCGMLYEGTLRASDVNNQGICDTAMYSILAREYFDKKRV